MSHAEDDAVGGVPTRTVHDAWVECLRTRQQFNQARDLDEGREVLHRRLQNAVYTLFEALRPALREESAVEDHWHGSDDHHIGRQQCLEVPVEPGSEETTVLTDGQVTQLARDDEEAYRYVQSHGEPVTRYHGLEALDGKFSNVDRELRTTESLLGTTQTVETSAATLPVDTLLAAARELDSAARELDLLFNVSASVPRTEITDEMLEDLEEWRRKNV